MSQTVQQSLAAHLRAAFNIEVNQEGLNAVTIAEDGVYGHVFLESSTFIFSDTDIKKLFSIAKRFHYGFYFTPRGERRSDARHFITFHN